MDQFTAGLFVELAYDESIGSANVNNVWNSVSALIQPVCNTTTTTSFELHLLKVGTDGSSSDMLVKQSQNTNTITYGRLPENRGQTGRVPISP